MISALIPGADLQKQTEADNIQTAWSHWTNFPSGAELKTAAQLAQEGYLSTVKNMRIYHRDISEISSDDMGKLVSIVTDQVDIARITPVSQLGVILASVQSKELQLGTKFGLLKVWGYSLNEENTRALVTAMRSRVQTVRLEEITLDLELLTDYDGQGHCTRLEMWPGQAWLQRWAWDRGWTVKENFTGWIVKERQ